MSKFGMNGVLFERLHSPAPTLYDYWTGKLMLSFNLILKSGTNSNWLAFYAVIALNKGWLFYRQEFAKHDSATLKFASMKIWNLF